MTYIVIFLTIFLCYGITNIIVNGSIFEGIKDNIDQKLTSLLSSDTQHNFMIRIMIWMMQKVLILTNCMMCTGFWIGMFLSILTLICPISLFGIQLQLVIPSVISTDILNVLFMSCFLSGTTWLINSISVFFGDGEAPSRINHNYDN